MSTQPMDAWDGGYYSPDSGIHRHNPYQNGSSEFVQWDAGLKARVREERRAKDKKEKETTRIAPQTWNDIINTEPPPLDFVFPGMLRRAVALIVSPGGGYKSTLAGQLALGFAGGCNTLFPNESNLFEITGKTVLLSAEDPFEITHHRFRSIAPMVYHQRDLLEKNLIIYPLVGRGFQVTNQKWSDWVLSVGEGARVIVIDTLRRTHSADENDNGAMAEILGIFERIAMKTGAAVILLHHTPKYASEDEGTFSARGASAVTDNARCVYGLRRLTDEEAKRCGFLDRVPHVTMWTLKSNYGPAEQFWFERGERGLKWDYAAFDVLNSSRPEGGKASRKQGRRAEA